VRAVGNAINPWWISGGVLVVAQKKTAAANAEPPERELVAESLVR
jgi:hypothetical protein